ncbi:MAG: PepSY domain-containing protein [Marinosulfonomonas sp.]|nr:PepSY domain-containing protein [Marinosulfonomonas sp.]
MSRKFRNLVFTAHKWLGLHFALFFGFMFFSGSILLFSDEIEALFTPDILVGSIADNERVSFGTIFQSVNKAVPGGTVFVIAKRPKAGFADRSFGITASGKRIIAWTDPRDARVLSIGPNRSFHYFLKELHESLLVPKRIGFLAVSATSGILLISVLAGLITYRRFWRGLLRLPNRSMDERNRKGVLHRLIAVWVTPFLLLISLTGMFFFLGGLGFNGYVPPAPEAQPREVARPAGFDGALIDRAEQAALTQYPDFRAKTVNIPGARKHAFRFGGALGSPTILGNWMIAVDPVSLDVLGIVTPADRRGNARITPVANALHYGTWGGLTSRIIWAMFGLASTYLVFAGVRIYLARTAPGDALDIAASGWRRYLSGLGKTKWIYLAAVLLVVALFVKEYVI